MPAAASWMGLAKALSLQKLWAGGYDAKWSFYIQATTRETLARLVLRPQDRVLEIL